MFCLLSRQNKEDTKEKMGLFNNIFRKKKVQAEAPPKVSGKCLELLEWEQFLEGLGHMGHYISRKEYLPKIQKFSDTMQTFRTFDENELLEDYCWKNGFEAERARALYRDYERITELVDGFNDRYIKVKLTEEQDYLDHILEKVDPVIRLDEDQRTVVLSDEDYSLVVAGAGAGKTTTIAAKVKYLVEKQQIDPSRILIISFTNKAVNELKEKINRDLNIPCPIATFHSTGNAILHKNNPEKLNIVDGSKLYYCVQEYFRGTILRNPGVVNSLILFFASYFDAPYEGDDINRFFNHMASANYATMRSELNDFKEEIIDRNSRKKVTIQNEIVRSMQEVEIANFLYLNGIDYTYEPVYPYHILMASKPYTPDFQITQDGHTAYIEHFGITEDGKNFLYDEEELAAYKRAVHDKILLHRQHGTKLIYTFSSYDDKRSISAHLEENLAKHGFELRRRSNEEIIHKLIAMEENKYIRRLVFLVINFIRNFKVNGYGERKFDDLTRKSSNVRTRLFLDICRGCYLEYKKYLIENHAVDFEDMINESARVLNEVKEMKEKLDFRYLIVDEYQDISRQRFDLVRSFSEVTDAKIVAVGDDWQSIYAFSGSDITLFTKFAEKMGYAKLMKIIRTYRNSQEVIDIAGNFIQKNASQIRKSLLSPKHLEDPVIIYTYDGAARPSQKDRRSGRDYALACAVLTALEQIMEYDQMAGVSTEESRILLLGRFGFDGERLARTGLFEYINRGAKLRAVKYPKLDITFMTAHASKGLGYDNVIVVNGRNETYGFPSKIEDDPVLSLVVKEDRSMQYAEERRLFYVAMTRTRNRVYFIASEKNPSEFLLEIKREYKNVCLRGNWSEKEPEAPGKKKCPVCGFPLQLRYKAAYGLKLYLCTNEPEICSFMSNDLAGRKLSIMKCTNCQDGYLIVKRSKNGGRLLGCSNYRADGTGCGNMMSKRDYYKKMEYEYPDPADLAVSGESRPERPASRDVAKEPAARSTDKVRPNRPERPVSRDAAKAPREGERGQETSQTARAEEKDPADQNRRENWEQEMLDRSREGKEAAGHFPEYKGHSVFVIAETVLHALVHVSDRRYFGVSVLAGVLRGLRPEMIVKYRLDAIAEYGSMAYLNREEAAAVIGWLIDRNYILQTKGRYPVLHITNLGLTYKEHLTPRNMKSLAERLQEFGSDAH